MNYVGLVLRTLGRASFMVGSRIFREAWVSDFAIFEGKGGAACTGSLPLSLDRSHCGRVSCRGSDTSMNLGASRCRPMALACAAERL